MLPDGPVHDQPEDLRPLPDRQAAGRGLLRQGDAGRAQEERWVTGRGVELRALALHI